MGKDMTFTDEEIAQLAHMEGKAVNKIIGNAADLIIKAIADHHGFELPVKRK